MPPEPALRAHGEPDALANARFSDVLEPQFCYLVDSVKVEPLRE